ncbi:MAG: hypothetical protein ACRDYZ_12375 [Acidimicrobiales bacterium]
MDGLLKRLSRTAFRRGLAGEHWAWLVLAGATYLIRRARRSEGAATTLALEPEQRYLVRLVTPDGRRGRKAAKYDVEVAGVALADSAGRPAPDSGDAGSQVTGN